MSDDQPTPSVEELRAENERLTAELKQLEAKPPKQRHPGRARNVTAIVIVIIATLLLPITLVAHWGNQTVNDPEQFAQTMGPLAADDSIQKAVSGIVTNAIVKQLDLQTKLSTDLPPKLQPLSGAIAGGVNSFIGTVVDKFFASPQFQQLWTQINLRLAEAMQRALNGQDGGAVSLQGNELVLDTGDLIANVQQQLVDRGLSAAANITVPAAADRQIVLMDAPQLAEVRSIYKLTSPIAAYGIYVVFLLFIIAIFVSTKRMRMVMFTGIGFIVGAILLRILMSVGESSLGVAFADTPFAGTEDAFFTTLTTFLKTSVQACFVFGLILAIVGWLAGGSSAANSARRGMSSLSAAGGKRTTNAQLGAAGRWVLRYRNVLRVVVVVVAALILVLLGRVTAGSIIAIAVFAVIAWAVIEYFSAVGRANAIGDDTGADQAAEISGSENVSAP